MSTKCEILTDSTCDFSAEHARELGVGVLPFHYTEGRAGGLEGDDDLFETRGAHEFYDAIRNGACPLTSQPSQLEFEEALRERIEEGSPMVLLCISSGLSGGCNGALTALERIHEQDPATERVPVYVVDSLCASTTLYLLVQGACERRDAGWSAKRVHAWAEDAKWRTQTLFMVDDLDTLHRGGRIPRTAAALGGALDVKPLLTFDLAGQLSVTGVARGRRKGMRRLIDNYSERRSGGTEGLVVGIGDADCPKDGDRLAEMVGREVPDARVLRSTIGPTIGAHVGPDMLSCCFWGKDRRR